MLENARERVTQKPGSINIRGAGLKDLREMQRLEQMCFDVEAFSKFQLRYLLTSPTAISLAAEAEGNFAGFVIGIVNRNRYGTYGRIYTLDVDEAYRGRGVGTELTRVLIDHLAAAGCEKCFLEVRVDNYNAIALYTRMGFEKKGIVPDYYAPGVDAIKMKKDL